MPGEKEVFKAIIKNLWDGEPKCPFQVSPPLPIINGGAVDVVADVSDQTAADTVVKIIMKLAASS